MKTVIVILIEDLKIVDRITFQFILKLSGCFLAEWDDNLVKTRDGFWRTQY